MVDVAVVAVVSSSTVALASVASNVWNAALQRTHDARQGYEDRVWERKAEVLPDLIGVALRLRRAVDPPEPGDKRSTYAVQHLGADVVDALAELERLQPGVVAYASGDTESALANLIDSLYATGIETGLTGALEYVREQMKEALSEEERATWGQSEANIMETLNLSMDLDADRISRLSTAVIAAAQESVRGR